MRPAAQVEEIALRVERDVAVGRVDELDLVRLALALESAARLVAVDLLALPVAPLGDLAADLLLEPLEHVLARPARETRSRSRSRSRSAGRSPPSCPGRAGAPPRRAGARPSGGAPRARRDRPCRGWSGSGSPRRPEAAAAGRGRPVRADEDGLLGELRADCARGVEPGGTVRKLELGAIWKDDPHAEQDTQAPAEQDPDETEEGSPTPDPERENGGDAEDVPTPAALWGQPCILTFAPPRGRRGCDRRDRGAMGPGPDGEVEVLLVHRPKYTTGRSRRGSAPRARTTWRARSARSRRRPAFAASRARSSRLRSTAIPSCRRRPCATGRWPPYRAPSCRTTRSTRRAGFRSARPLAALLRPGSRGAGLASRPPRMTVW